MGRLRPTRVLASALGATCTRLAAAREPRQRAAGGAPPESYYDAGGAVPDPVLREREEQRGGFTERVLLPARLPDALRHIPLADDPIEILHYAPRDTAEAAPLIVMSPILGNTTMLVDRVARSFARRGLHAAIVQRKALAFDPRTTVEQAEEEVRLVVMRSRQAVDWLVGQPGVDRRRIGTFGASAGGIVSSMLAGADSRFGAHVWLMPGGPLSDVMAHTVEGEYRAYRTEAMRTSGKRLSELRELMRRTFRTDPIRLAPRVPREDVLMVLARFDRSVPYRYGLALWRSLGRPERLLVPLGHYTTLLLLPWLEQVSLDFFGRRFARG